MRAAPTGRTHGCSDQAATCKKSLPTRSRPHMAQSGHRRAWAAGSAKRAACSNFSSILALFVEPEVLKTPVVIDAVLVQHDAFDVRVPAGRRPVVENDRPDHVLGQLALDLPHQLLALREVDFLRLPENQVVD